MNAPTAAARPRVHALDFLRGCFILLACIQHYSGFINAWYPPGTTPPARLAIDDTIWFLFQTLSPWGDHLFLFLAAFNLSIRSRDDFREVFPAKVRFYGVLALFFLFEPFLVERNLGDALTFGPLLAWMIILTLLALLHRAFGWKGVAAAFALHLLVFAFDVKASNDTVEAAVREALALPGFRYESRLDLFFGSGCVGFLLGTWYHHGPRAPAWRMETALGVAIVAFLPWLLWGTWWQVDRHDVWRFEYVVAESGLGLLVIWAFNAAAIAGLLLIEHRWRPVRVPIVNWLGISSLLAFAMHRVVFARILAPLRDYVAFRYELPVHNTIGEVAVFIAFTLLAVLVVQKTRMLRVLDR